MWNYRIKTESQKSSHLSSHFNSEGWGPSKRIFLDNPGNHSIVKWRPPPYISAPTCSFQRILGTFHIIEQITDVDNTELSFLVILKDLFKKINVNRVVGLFIRRLWSTPEAVLSSSYFCSRTPLRILLMMLRTPFSRKKNIHMHKIWHFRKIKCFPKKYLRSKTSEMDK